MANLQGRDEEGVSLFPMFNILACTLGVMVFVLATVATVSLGADKAVEYVTEDPTDQMRGRLPFWIAWDGREMILLPSRAAVTFERDLSQIPAAERPDYIFSLIAGTDVGRAISSASLAQNRYAVLLVRPSGFRTLPHIAEYFELLSIDVMPEPIDQDLRRLQVR